MRTTSRRTAVGEFTPLLIYSTASEQLVQLDAENRRFQDEMQKNVQEREEVDAEAFQLLELLAEVCAATKLHHA